MQYVPFGSTGINISKLGFGCMRFPAVERDGKTVFDEGASIAMLRRAAELGVNYFDTAPGYCGTVSEIIVGKALVPIRDKVYISTKNPISDPSGDAYERRLEHSLCQLGTDVIDFYHFWGIGLDSYITNIDVPDGPLARAIRLKEQGVLRHICFSFHDEPKNMIEIIRRGQGVFSTVLCQYNLLDRSHEEAIAFAREQGLGVVVMGPVGGGRLGAPSPVIQQLLPGKAKSSAETALRFVLNNPGVHVALSGMSTMDMVEENCRVAGNVQPLTDEEKRRIDDMLQENARLAELYCTGCNYCMPCPAGLNIPEIFKMMNYHRVYGLTGYARDNYAQIGKSEWMKYENAAACTSCGLCETKCPQKLRIRDQLRQTHEALSR